MELVTAIGTINNAVSLAKALRSMEKNYDAALLKMQIADLLCNLAEIKIQHTEMAERIRELEGENARLVQVDKEIDGLGEHGGYRFKTNAEGALTGWPACPSCLVKSKSVVLMVQKGHVDGASCPGCGYEMDPVPSFIDPGVLRSEDRKRKHEETRRRSAEALSRLNRF